VRCAAGQDVLTALDACVDELTDEMLTRGVCPDARDVAQRSGLDIETVCIALRALDGEYLEVRYGGDFAWGIPAVTPAARRAVGQWPTAENLTDSVIAALEQAAENETELERRNRLRTLAAGLGSMARDLAVSVMAPGNRTARAALARRY
jgi:hypothetical protein